VRLGRSKKDNAIVAVKVISRTDLPDAELIGLRQEVKILRGVIHPNIVRLLDFFEESDYCYIILEYLEGGELFDRIVEKQHFYEREARSVIFAILTALKYCHERNIVHR
jgi:calcium/calmodulin-dependent protein kinase I